MFWKTLQSSIGLSRKLFRAGKPISLLKIASAVYANKTQDPILRLTSFVRNISLAIYFTTDTVTWINLAKVHSFTHAAAINRIGLQFWLLGLLANILNSLRRQQIASEKIKALESESEKDTSSIKKAKAEKHAADVQLLWDSLDTAIPISGLNYANLDDGFVGLAGLITSLIGFKQQWAATA